MSKTAKEYLITGDNYFPNTEMSRSKELPPGAYECGVTMEGAPFFRPITIVTDEIVSIPNSFTEEILTEIKQFWSAGVSEKFKKYGLVQKRGVLLEGKAGCGKTICLAEAAKIAIKEFGAVVLFNPDPDSLPEFLRMIKDIEENKKIMIMWEEFDSILSGSESTLLSLLDGEIQVGNIIYLATTNYISKIPARIKNRPSRFAKIVSVKVPDATARETYLNAKLAEEDKHMIPSMVQSSEGFVIDQLKDMIISVCCFGYSISDAVLKIREMEEDSMGYDDYNEDQAKSVFKKTPRHNNRGRLPLNPLR